DSFCQYVVRNNFNAIGIDPSFRVGDSAELTLIKEEVMSGMLEEEYEKARRGENPDFVYAMEYFSVGSSDKKIEEYIERLHKFADSMPFPEDWIRERAGDYDLEGRNFDELDWVKKAIEYAKTTIDDCAALAKTAADICLEPDGPYMYEDLLRRESEMFSDLKKYETYDELFDALRTVSFDRLPGKKDDSVNGDKREYVRKLRDKYKDAIKKYTETYFALTSGTIIDQMKLCDRAVKELCRLTLLFEKGFEEIKRERQVIDFSDMEHFALRILVNHPSDEECAGLSAKEIFEKCTPTTVALEYREYFKEVLIDEYQDSNSVQEMVLKAISGENAGISERFMVGDVKQSIYKFRLARPEIFMEKFHKYDRDPAASDRRIDLHKNFRSRKEVLESTNYIFQRIMGEDLGGVDYDKDAELVTGASYDPPTFDVTPELIIVNGAEQGGDLEDEDARDEAAERDISLQDYDLLRLNAREKEALAVAERIKSLRQENPDLDYKDMVILLRATAGWDDVFKRVLEDNGIPAYIESKSGYFDMYEVSVLLNLLSAVDNPRQDIQVISVMKSPLGGFDDEELALLRIAVDKDEEACLCDSFFEGLTLLGDNALSKDLYDKLTGFISFMADLRERAEYTPVHVLLQYVLDETGDETLMTALPGGEQRRANIEQLINYAVNFEKTSFKGLFHFVRYIEHVKAVKVDYGEAGTIDENADVVRIMSIHKSKGLEFPVVFASGLNKRFDKRDITGDLIADMDLGLGVKCIDSEKRLKFDTLKRLVIAKRMLSENMGEELRVLYVALTRAKEKLIMTSYVKDAVKDLSDRFADMAALFGEGRLLPYSKRLDAKSYYDFVIRALIGHPAMAQLRSDLEITVGDFETYRDKSENVPALKIYTLCDEDLKRDLAISDLMGVFRKEDLNRSAELADKDMLSVIKEKFEGRYSHSELKGLFTKTSVTELKKKMLEEEGEVFTKTEEFADYAENEEKEEKEQTGRLTGAERGTAYHRIMELLDEDIYGNEEFMETTADPSRAKECAAAIRKWMAKKVSENMIPGEYAECVYAPDIVAFLSCDLGKRMGQAFRNGTLYREKPFMMGVSASNLDKRFPEDEMVLVQGIIDAWFTEGDDIILMDYKTDRVDSAKELTDRYHIQLDYYKDALERATDKKVKEVFIYSFGLSKDISL
nr:helicase-exonuclease AddAB subunit AddA [Butyrivibrio sp.]